MNDERSFARFMADRLEDGGIPLPDAFYDDMHTFASHARQRPRWLVLIKEPPMRIDSHLAVGSPTVRIAAVLGATLLLAIAAVGAGIAGSRLLAADGTIVVDQGGNGTTTTIGEALAMADDGDEIVIRPGTYVESITIDEDITLACDGAAADVIIAVPEDAPALPDEIAPLCRMGCTGTAGAQFGIYLAETSATVSDLTVLGLPHTAAVVVNGGEPTLERLVIDIEGDPARSSVDAARHGLVIDHGSAALVRDVSHEGWMTVDRGASPTIEESRLLDTCIAIWGEGTAAVFRANTITACPNGFAFDIAHGAFPILEGNDISGGQDGFPVVGVSQGTASSTHAVIEGIRIHDASASTAGILVDMGATAEVADNELYENGTAILISDGGAVIGNDVHDNGTGISVNTGSTAAITDNEVASNDLGLALRNREPLTLSGNTICGNETNLSVARDAAPPDTQENEICADDPAPASG